MAIIKRNTRYQVKIRGTDGKWLSYTCGTLKEAKEKELSWKHLKFDGTVVDQKNETITVAEFFESWIHKKTYENSQSGWCKTQKQYFRDYIGPVIGSCRVRRVMPNLIQEIFFRMRERKLSPKTQLLVYQTINGMFRRAVREGIRGTSPVLEDDKPRVPIKEAKHLNIEQVQKLLDHVKGKPYGVAIWIQAFLGLRVSELQALQWVDLDLSTHRVVIRRAFVNRTKVMRDYPKGGKQHTQTIPNELAQFLSHLRDRCTHNGVIASEDGKVFSYRWYNKKINKYCTELGIPVIGTHGLRHTTAEIYLSYGASKEDVKDLFAHSGMNITERYIHNWKSNLVNVARNIQLLQPACSQNVPN